MQLQEVSVGDLKPGTRASLTPESLRANFPKYGKVNCSENDGNVQIIVRYHNHVIAAYQTQGELDKDSREKIKAAITKRVQESSDAVATKYISALHESQKAARARKKSS
jgi:hypothetical protein